MPNGVLPEDGRAVPPADLRLAGAWLERHGLADARPTPLLAVRLAARRRARVTSSVLLATLLIGAGLTQAVTLISAAANDGDPYRWPPVLLLALVVGLVAAQSVLDGWVRRVDQRAGAGRARRAAYPVDLGWRAVVGRPYAVFAVATFAGAAALAASVLPVRDATLRYGALVVLIGALGVAVGIVIQLRHLLARPAVAEDEQSLTADLIMRVEDARELATPTVLWALPAVLLYGTTLGWWNAVAIALVIVGAVALCMIRARTAPIAVVARQAMGTR